MTLPPQGRTHCRRRPGTCTLARPRSCNAAYREHDILEGNPDSYTSRSLTDTCCNNEAEVIIYAP